MVQFELLAGMAALVMAIIAVALSHVLRLHERLNPSVIVAPTLEKEKRLEMRPVKFELPCAGLSERLAHGSKEARTMFEKKYCLVEAMMVITTAAVSTRVLFIALLS